MSFVIIMVLLLVVRYVLMIRPQRQRQATQKRTIDTAGVGDDVLTTGGIYGTITQADGDDVVVEIAKGLEVHMTRRAIAAVLPPEDEEEDGENEDKPTEGEAEPEAAEAGATDDTEPSDGAHGEPETPAAADEREAPPAAESGRDDEGAVADGEEPVRSEGGAEAPRENPL